MRAEVPAGKRAKTLWPSLVSAILSLIGLGDAIYLTVQHLSGASVRCTLISGCSEVLSSSYSHIGPIPLAAIGAVAYFVVFSLAVLSASGYQTTERLLMVVVSLMFLTTLWLVYLQAFVIHHFCQYCLLSAAVTTALLGVVIFARFNRRPQ